LALPRHVYLQPDAADPVLPAEVVLALVQQHVPDARSVVAVEESGGEARTYRIDDDVILKVQRPPQLRPLTNLAKEVFFLEQLAALPEARRVSVPRVLGHGTAESIEYTVLTRMPGVALIRTTLTAPARHAVLVDLGQALRSLHALPLEPFVASGIVPGDLAFMDTMTRIAEPLLDRAREVRERGLAWDFPLTIEQIAGRALSSLPYATERAALHSNPYEEHTFVDPERGVFSGLIDFGDAYISHPALEIRRWNRPADRDALLAGYQKDGQVTDDWLAVWRALMIVADVDTMLRVPERAAEARRDLVALLAEL
jgi:aminoglycoside phosphotransferase (APT) family kinase protein